MQLKITPESLLEWLALQLNKVPVPLLHGQVFPVISKAVLEASDAGIFDAVYRGHRTAAAIASHCNLDPRATGQLLDVLVPLGYLRVKKGIYSLTRMAKKWVLAESANSIAPLLTYNNQVVWPWLEGLGDYLKTGKGVEYHARFLPSEWERYQEAMLAVARSEAAAFAAQCPVPQGARRMLDIGGAHGLHSVTLCERYPALESTILDLPEALEKAPVFPGRERLGNRLSYLKGNILETELPENAYDLVLMSSLAHHFTADQNAGIARKAAAALRRGGIFVINEFVKPDPERRPELVGSSSNLFFGLTSTSGTWSIEETRQWQADAGLRPSEIIGYTAIPGRYQLVARKE